MLDDGSSLGVTFPPVAIFGEFFWGRSCRRDVRSWFNWESGEDVGVALGMTPVTLALEDLADAVSPGVVVRRACKEFDVVKLNGGHSEVRCKLLKQRILP